MTETPKRRGPGRPKGSKASEAQKATAPAARAASAEARKKRKAERDAAAKELEVPRWKQLEDGTIGVKDLTLDELVRGEVSNNDGTWEGRRHQFDTRMLSRMAGEYKRRIRNNLDKLAPLALDAIEDILYDDEARAQQFAASKMVLEYQIGKVPDVVHVGQETEWERLQQTGFRIVRGVEAVQVDDEEDVVDAELVED
jgi:hypothetical protein